MRSNEEKIKKYEDLLHLIQLNYSVTMNSKNVRKLLNNIDAWSYAHRRGNGELTEEEQQEQIDKAFDELTSLD
jgi:hypothetical protein